MSAFDSLQVDSVLSYLIAFLIPALDAIFPALPGESAIIALGVATAVAAVIWALYAFFIGRVGGQAFEDNPWAGLVIAFGASIAISALIEVIRRLWGRRRRRAQAAAARAEERAPVLD